MSLNIAPNVRFEIDLQQLLDAASRHLKASRIKDMKTAVRVLAKVLGYSSPDACPRSAYDQPLEAIYVLVSNELVGRGEHTVRNTKNNLSLLFRTAKEHDLLPGNTTEPKKFRKSTSKFDLQKQTARTGSECSKKHHYYLRKDEWTPSLTQEFEKFAHWATAPVITGRPAKVKKRLSTIKLYRDTFSAYLGYLHQEQKIPHQDLCLELLVDPDKLQSFVHWHVNTLHQRVTRFIVMFLNHVSAFINQYKPNPATLERVNQLRGEIGTPKPVYIKEEAWVPLVELDAIGRTIWPTRMPQGGQGKGKGFARLAVMSLMLQLWCRRPYRQRNMREMKLGENLYKNTEGEWKIRFIGEELKIGRKKGRVNQFELSYPADLVPDLEAYLSIWRPLLIQGQSSPPLHVFLNKNGDPFQNESTLNQAVRNCVYSHIGKPFHPHLIRTIWATEYIREGLINSRLR